MPRHSGQTQRLIRRLAWAEIDKLWLKKIAQEAREEDINGLGLIEKVSRPGDPTSALFSRTDRAQAALVARQEMTLAGLGLISIVLDEYGSGWRVNLNYQDGDTVSAGAVIAKIEGPIQNLLMAERIVLNFLQKLTGVATLTKIYSTAISSSPTKILDTRKTTPGFRVLEKYAVGQGGGYNNRLGLYDRVMIKDNHLAAGGATKAERLMECVKRAREARPDLLVEVEVDAIEQIEPVLEAGVDIILLDNFSLPQLAEALPQVRARAWTEVSGGVTLNTLPRIAALSPDFISVGALTHSAVWADIGLDWL
jgi:nicotinate-nucleotide pyrophosphorylase (carboxylating)